MSNKVTEEIETIEIPQELRVRSRLGIEKAKQERNVSPWKSKLAKSAMIAAAGAGLIVALGSATSPTFASYVKSLFLFYNVDEGLKKAADDGFTEAVNRQVTDQGITFRVKEVVNDMFRLSILLVLEKDGKPIDPERLLDIFDPSLARQEPFENEFGVTDEQGNRLNLGNRWETVGDSAVLSLSLDELAAGREVKSLADLPDRINIHFDMIHIAGTDGKWHMNVPIDLAKAKASAAVIPINKRYTSPFGFSIDFLQLHHGPSKSEMLLQVNESQQWRRSYKGSPSFRYEIRDGQGKIVAAKDAIGLTDLEIGNNNTIQQFMSGRGSYGQMRHWQPFVPFKEAKDLTLEVTAIYTQEKTAEDFSVTFDPKELMKQPLAKETEGKKLAFTARIKTEEAKERLSDSREAFKGTGWIIEVDQQLGSDTLDLKWEMQHGPENAEQATLLSKDNKGNYRNRTLFFFRDTAAISERVTMAFNRYTKSNPVSWSIPLKPSSDLLPNAPRAFDMTIEDLNRPEIVARAEQAMRELTPGEPAQMYGVTEFDDRWFFHLKDPDTSIVIVDKASGEPFILRRRYSYDQLNGTLRQKAEQAMKELDPGRSGWFDNAERVKREGQNEWIISGEKAEVVIDGATGDVTKATLIYPPSKLNPQIKAEAELAYAALFNGRELRVADVKRIRTTEKDVWELSVRGRRFEAVIGAVTQQLRSASVPAKDDLPKNDAEARALYATPPITAEQASAAAAPVVKQLFGVELDGYKASVQLNEYTFTKQGAPTVKAKFNAKGELWEYNLPSGQGVSN